MSVLNGGDGHWPESGQHNKREGTVDASPMKAYCCTARITWGSEMVLTLWVYIYQAQR